VNHDGAVFERWIGRGRINLCVNQG
jgi:hypothetical protein